MILFEKVSNVKSQDVFDPSGPEFLIHPRKDLLFCVFPSSVTLTVHVQYDNVVRYPVQ